MAKRNGRFRRGQHNDEQGHHLAVQADRTLPIGPEKTAAESHEVDVAPLSTSSIPIRTAQSRCA